MNRSEFIDYLLENGKCNRFDEHQIDGIEQFCFALYDNTELDKMQDRIAELEEVLQKLHKLGGLGLDKHKWIEEALKGGDNYVIINDQGDTFSRYPKGLFERVNLPKPLANPNNDAYQKIIKVEYYQTTDGKEFVIERDAMLHQLMLDVENTFVEPHGGAFAISLRDLLEWSKAELESFDTLVRLVGEQR